MLKNKRYCTTNKQQSREEFILYTNAVLDECKGQFFLETNFIHGDDSMSVSFDSRSMKHHVVSFLNI